MIAILIVMGVAAALALFAVLTYNRLVARRLACENSWAQIDVALKNRHDLVPRLAEVVAGYARHERSTLEGVTEARSAAVAADGAGPAQRSGTEAALTSGIGRVVVLAEDYPELLATENFMALQRELSEVEEKISITRRVYNDTVETYNTSIMVFPSVLVARPFGFARREFFDAPAAADLAPSISGLNPVEPTA